MRPSERLFWVLLSGWWANWQRSLIIVQPATVLRWRRLGLCAICLSGSCGHWRGGRPRINSEIRALIVRMSQENFLWGAPRIHGELLKLGFDVSQATVSRYMPRRGYPLTQTWRTFLRNQAFGIGTIGLGEAGRLSDKLLALVRGWIARVVRCVTKVRGGFRCGLIELSLTLHRLRPCRSSNRTARRDPRSGCVPVRWPPTRSRPRRQLDYGPVDGFRRIAQGHHRRASCRHSRILHDQPRSRAQAAHNSYNAIVLHVCHEQLAQKGNDPQCPSPTPRLFRESPLVDKVMRNYNCLNSDRASDRWYRP